MAKKKLISKKTRKTSPQKGGSAARKSSVKKTTKKKVSSKKKVSQSKGSRPVRKEGKILKKRAKSPKGLSTKDRNKFTLSRINELATDVVDSSLAERDPFMEVPTRAVSNMHFNRAKRILEMGENTQRRELFNLNQARKFMQTLLLAKGCYHI